MFNALARVDTALVFPQAGFFPRRRLRRGGATSVTLQVLRHPLPKCAGVSAEIRR